MVECYRFALVMGIRCGGKRPPNWRGNIVERVFGPVIQATDEIGGKDEKQDLDRHSECVIASVIALLTLCMPIRLLRWGGRCFDVKQVPIGVRSRAGWPGAAAPPAQPGRKSALGSTSVPVPWSTARGDLPVLGNHVNHPNRWFGLSLQHRGMLAGALEFQV